MIRSVTFGLIVATLLLWFCAWATAEDQPVSPRTFVGALQEDKQANLIRMKRTPFSAGDPPKAKRSTPDNIKQDTANQDSYKKMSGQVSNHHVHGPEYGLDLPPICPMVRDHLHIEFKANSGGMDPFGLPCLLEMHWSLEEAPRFEAMECKRKYQLFGFTDWVCEGFPSLVSRFTMIYHIECLDVGPDGRVTDLQFERDSITNPAWLPRPASSDTNNSETPFFTMPLTPSQHLAPGHYCYLRYVIESNTQWFNARIVILLVAAFGWIFTIIGFLINSTCAAIVTNAFYAFSIASISGISLVVVQFSDYLSNDALWWLPVGNVLVFSVMSLCWFFPMTLEYRLLKRRSIRKTRDGYYASDDDSCGEDIEQQSQTPAGPTFTFDYDELAKAMSIVHRASSSGQELRPRGEMAAAIAMAEAVGHKGGGEYPGGSRDIWNNNLSHPASDKQPRGEMAAACAMAAAVGHKGGGEYPGGSRDIWDIWNNNFSHPASDKQIEEESKGTGDETKEN